MNDYKKEDRSKIIGDDSPLKLVTHIIVCLQLADGIVEFEEREAWADILIDFFLDYKHQRALEALREAGQYISALGDQSKTDHAVQCFTKLKDHFEEDYLREKLLPRLEEIIGADGVVLASESNMIEKLRGVFQVSD